MSAFRTGFLVYGTESLRGLEADSFLLAVAAALMALNCTVRYNDQ